MNTKFSRILVTGGAGFIGSHVVEKLVAQDLEVGILDISDVIRPETLALGKELQIHRGDIRDLQFVRQVTREYEAIIHEAASLALGTGEDSFLVHGTNVTGTLNMLTAALESNTERFVYASSAAVYGDQKFVPLKEDLNPNPVSVYGASKLAGEKYCHVFSRGYGLKTVCLRYFNVYGPGRRTSNSAGVISSFIDRLSRGQAPVIFGDGEQTRDFVHVDDVVDATLLALGHGSSRADVFNVATSKATSIKGLGLELANLMNAAPFKPIHAEARPGDVRQSVGDFSRAREELGYTPRVKLNEGLAEFLGVSQKSAR